MQGESIEFMHGRIDDIHQDLKSFKKDMYNSVEGVIVNHNKLVGTVT